MIYVTGDCHSDLSKFTTKNFPEQKELTKEDYVIVCGDFGLLWDQEESRSERFNLDWLEEKPFTTLFVDGNHENFDRLSKLPEVDFCGGKAGLVRPSVLYLKRGEVYNINGTKVFAFGGARSHDISDGILDKDDPKWKDKARFLDSRGKYMYRVRGLSWWEEEMPTKEEMEYGLDNLSNHDYKVDLIVSHCCPSSIQSQILPYGDYDELTDYFNYIKNAVEYDQWYFGHYHYNCPIDEKHGCLYQYILPWNNERELCENELLYR